MTEPMTLGGAFEQPVENPYGAEFAEERRASDAFDHGVDATKALFEHVVYGTDEPCPECKGANWGTRCYGGSLVPDVCPACHGTGRDRTPGLGDRLQAAFLCGDGTYDGFAVERLLEAIRREIGEAP